MTRNELKQLIRQTLEESRVRRTPPGYNAALRMAAADFKAKEAEKAAAKAADDAKLAQMGGETPEKFRSKYVNIKHRFDQLSGEIKSLEDRIAAGKLPEETDMEYIERALELLKSKTQLELDRLEYASALNDLNTDIANFEKNNP